MAEVEHVPDYDYEKFFHVSVDLLCICGFDGYFKKLTPRWMALLGWTEAELLAKPFVEFVHPDDRDSTIAEAAKLAGGDHVTICFENRYACKDGSYRWMRWTARGVLEDQLLYAAATDVSDLKHKNEELDQFAYIVSHDLKSPLRAICSLSDWVVEDEGNQLTEASVEYLDLMHRRSARLSDLIDGVLNYSKVGRITALPENVDTGILVKSVWRSLDKPKHAELRVADDMPVLFTGGIPLRQVFQNLISNAIKYGPSEGLVVQIDCVHHGRWVEFSVTDNGPGIPEKYAEKIFELFQTLQPKDAPDSTGIGLALVDKIVRSYGGRVRLDTAQGGGARFVFSWREDSLNAPETSLQA
ncbi:MAG: PAS domain S-box-containing protein [Kiritimatiellia bacterium]|jgi:PAS domain S-box-containing protein